MKTERITSRQNPLLVHLKKLLNSRTYRRKNNAFAGDGVKLLQEAVKWGAKLETVVMTEGAVDFPLPEDIRVVEIPQDVMASVSLMEAPQGAIFICTMPEKKELQLPETCLVLDGLQDPGNVGTILRTADAMDIPVVLTEDCADIYNPKTVRATMGAVFRMDIQVASREKIIAASKYQGVALISTALSERAEEICGEKLAGAVVIGSEGTGVSDELLNNSDREIIIPMNPHCESLNAGAAAAIVLWEMRKNR